MLPLNYPRRWRIAGVLLLFLILALALAPDIWPWEDTDDSRWNISDKWMHGLTFAGLALWYTGQYARRAYWLLTMGLLAFGGVIEVCQSMVSYRTAEWGDLVADTLGIAVGMSVALLVTGGWSLRIEQWLQRRFG
jgi:VanZ family protein